MSDDLQTFVALMTGERKPETELEIRWISFMGGTRGPVSQWAKKWTTCTECGSEWEQTGMPASHGKWVFHPVCKSCRRDFVQTKKRPARSRADLDN